MANPELSKPKTEERKLTNAYIIPAEIGDNIIKALGQLPWDKRHIYAPVLQYLEQEAFRGEVTIQIPLKPEPVKK